MDHESTELEHEEKRAKRGWYFAVVFLIIVVALIVFLARVNIVNENRDVLVGILGVLTGSISSMMAIASGRDPSELEELKDKLSSANADREALIARLRDSQIQLALTNSQINDLQQAIIERLSILASNEGIIKHKSIEDVELDRDVKKWLPESKND